MENKNELISSIVDIYEEIQYLNKCCVPVESLYLKCYNDFQKKEQRLLRITGISYNNYHPKLRDMSFDNIIKLRSQGLSFKNNISLLKLHRYLNQIKLSLVNCEYIEPDYSNYFVPTLDQDASITAETVRVLINLIVTEFKKKEIKSIEFNASFGYYNSHEDFKIFWYSISTKLVESNVERLVVIGDTLFATVSTFDTIAKNFYILQLNKLPTSSKSMKNLLLTIYHYLFNGDTKPEEISNGHYKFIYGK